MVEAAEPECGAFDAFDQIVDRLRGSVGDVRRVPGDDLLFPAFDRATEATDLERHRLIGEVAHDLIDPLDGEGGVGVVVDLADDLLSDNRPWGWWCWGSAGGLLMPGRLGSGGRDERSCGSV